MYPKGKLTPKQRATLEQKHQPEHIDAYIVLTDDSRKAEHAAIRESLKGADKEVLNRLWDDWCELDPEEILRKQLGDELHEFYTWLRKNGAASIGQMCAYGPVEGTSTVYKYLARLRALQLVAEVPPPPKQFKAIEPDGV
jgi:hypothetical protein